MQAERAGVSHGAVVSHGVGAVKPGCRYTVAQLEDLFCIVPGWVLRVAKRLMVHGPDASSVCLDRMLGQFTLACGKKHREKTLDEWPAVRQNGPARVVSRRDRDTINDHRQSTAHAPSADVDLLRR